MNFEILEGLPAYGTMYISIPENSYTEFSEGLAVRFFRKDQTQWIGNFAKGSTQLKFASNLSNTDYILIIAFGICYIINSEDAKIVHEFGYDYKKVFEYKDLLILIGEYSISIIKDNVEIKHFNDLCFEGISDAVLENESLKLSIDDYNFSKNGNSQKDIIFNLENMTFNEMKSWWKFW